MTLAEALRVLDALNREGVRYVLVGSMAMAVHGVVRATRDMDLFVSPDAETVAALRTALRSVYDDPDVDGITVEDLAGPYPVVQYLPPDQDVVIDLLARLGDAFAFDDLEWQVVPVEGVDVRVATPRMLYRMKRDTVRPQDRLDAARLAERFRLDDGEGR